MAENPEEKKIPPPSPAPPPKPATSVSTTPPRPTGPKPLPPSVQQAKPAVPVKGKLLSRRTFLLGAIGASTLFTVGAVSVGVLSPTGGILGPLLPAKEPPQVVADWNLLDSSYQSVKNTPALYNPTTYSQFFYYWYTSSQNTYYRNVVTRLPDAAGTNQAPYIGSLPADQKAILSKVVAYNTTCVHLQCLVNPGYSSNQFRLICPCHGSQYDLATGIPVAGPAHDLGLNPLPRIELSVDPASGKITATNIDGTVGIGRTD
jgi:Rieske Fe-S protein